MAEQSPRRTVGFLMSVAALSWMWAAHAPSNAHAASGPVQTARQVLLKYEANTDDGSTLAMLKELSAFANSEANTDAHERAEARFLRAAAATDLLVLARVRDDARLQPALEAALGVSAGTVYTHLDAELEMLMKSANYAQPAAQMRAALTLARDPKPAAHLQNYRGVSGSERDLLFLHAMSQLAISSSNPLAALAAYGETLKPGSAAAGAFDATGGQSVATLIEAGNALKRLNSAANDGDPIAASAIIERAVLAIAIPDITVPPAPKLLDGLAWTHDSKAPDLVLWINEQGVRYGFSPSAQLDTAGDIKLLARGEPALPATAELRFTSKPLPFIHPMSELSDWVQKQLASQPDLSIAVMVEPNTTAMSLGNTLASLKRGGSGQVTVLGRNAQGQAVLQNLGLIYKTAADTEPLPTAELGLRVRLGGYSLKLPSGQEQDIPRFKDDSGWHFDTASLGTQLGTRRFATAHVSFMPDVASDQVLPAIFQLGASTRAVSVLLQ